MTRSPPPPANTAAAAASFSSSAAAAPPPEAPDVESDFAVILAVLLCALICVVGLMAVARCAWLRRHHGRGRGGAGGGPEAAAAAAAASWPPPGANRGLKKKALQSLPKVVYSLEAAGAARFPVECAICLGEFSEGDEVRLLPQCGHGFHVGCIDPWLGSHSSCPSCRRILVVALCEKCGQFPAVPGDGTEAQLKAREDGGNSYTFLP